MYEQPTQIHWPEMPRKVGHKWEYQVGPRILTFWAEGGGIYVEDTHNKPGEEPRKSIMVPGWRARVDAFKQQLAAVEKDTPNDTGSVRAWKLRHRDVLKRLVDVMIEVGKQAVAQGDLSRPDVQKYYRDHVATVKQTHLVPGTILPH